MPWSSPMRSEDRLSLSEIKNGVNKVVPVAFCDAHFAQVPH